MTGPVGVTDCCVCTIKSVTCSNQHRQFFPLLSPNEGSRAGRPAAYDPNNLPLRNEAKYRQQVARLVAESDPLFIRKMQQELGVTGQTVYQELDTFNVPFFYPIDVFHITGLNIPDLIVKAFRDEGSGNCFCLSPSVWQDFGASVEANHRGLPAAFSPGGPRDPSRVGSGPYRAWEWSLVTYTYLGMFLHYRQAPYEVQLMLHSLRIGVSMVLGYGMTRADIEEMHRLLVNFARTWEPLVIGDFCQESALRHVSTTSHIVLRRHNASD